MNIIKSKLKELGKSQTWLAIETKLALPYINNIVNDKIIAPKITTAIKISRVMDMPIESLWSFEEKKNGSNELPKSTSS